MCIRDRLSGCAELVQPEVQHKQLQLQVMEAADPPLFVQGDPRRVRQILLNLLSNAIKYNSPRGMIRLGYEVRADCVRLWVDDTGPGLSSEQLAQLFQPFQRCLLYTSVAVGKSGRRQTASSVWLGVGCLRTLGIQVLLSAGEWAPGGPLPF